MYSSLKTERVRKKVYFSVCNLRKNWWARGNCFDFYSGVVVLWSQLIWHLSWFGMWLLSQMKYCIVYEWITGLLWGCSKSYEVENRTQQYFWVQRWCTMLPCSCIYNRIWFICYRFSHFADWNGFVVSNHSLSKS